jgi:uncharacterized glyoxalase superfamily protein PhnB
VPKNPPQGTPRISPYLFYENVAEAVDWLVKAFGFRERLRYAGPDGTVLHAELELADGLVMLGHPGSDYQNPKATGHVAQLVHIYVDDVDGHFERAKEAGAAILSEPTDQSYGDRRYDAEDPEGHRWSFAQNLRDVPPEEW